MLKLIRLSAALAAAAVIVSLPQIVRSRPAPGNSSYSSVRNTRSGSLYCYMRTPQGTLLNLENMCGPDNGSSDRAANITNNPATTPNGTVPNGIPNGEQPVTTTTVNGSVVPNSTNDTNPNPNSNPNGINPNALSNPNNTNPNGINPNTINNPNGINPNVNNSNLNGTNPNGINNPNVTNTSPNNFQ
ncbi:MAG TPA: hypothetical protein V6C95_00650 [Coleofasciculaceae cyanobacterium]